MASLLRKLYSPRACDVLFTFAGIVSMCALVAATGNDYPVVSASSEPITKGGTLLGVLAISAVLSAVAVQFDQRAADDYLFQTLTKSAYVGMATLLFASVIWEFALPHRLGGITSQVMIGMLVASWSLGYLYTRLRGTAAA